ncbi:hypothetical protein B0T10DRAFT_460944 [Thelonectria olida]|uniref:Uncharacterized protein n=1 Tax=Thelonectria olida TaxID=1576542 RepID=A0A9P9AKK7_9HYPO|nr:hypothetical protein B0T10DRAFT_460944 [Thelonectria olida]
MSSPATSTASSPNVSAHKRKRDVDAQAIIDDINERQASGEMSSPTKEISDIFLNRAKESLENDTVDQQMLRAGYQMFIKAEDRKSRKEPATADADAEPARDEPQSEQNKKSFLLECGDLFGALLSIFKENEGPAKVEAQRLLQDHYKKGGDKGREAVTKARKISEWSTVAGKSTTEVYTDICPEWDAVDEWKLGGEVEADAPWTPHLDRIELCCNASKGPEGKGKAVDRATVLQWIKHYSDRNEHAHHPSPRIGDFLKPGGWITGKEWESVDWVKMKQAIKVRKAQTRSRYEEGIYTKGQRDLFVDALTRQWMELATDSETDDGFTLTDAGKRAANHSSGTKPVVRPPTARPQPPSHYPSVYKKGKWDDIPRRDADI